MAGRRREEDRAPIVHRSSERSSFVFTMGEYKESSPSGSIPISISFPFPSLPFPSLPFPSILSDHFVGLLLSSDHCWSFGVDPHFNIASYSIQILQTICRPSSSFFRPLFRRTSLFPVGRGSMFIGPLDILFIGCYPYGLLTPLSTPPGEGWWGTGLHLRGLGFRILPPTYLLSSHHPCGYF